MSPRSVDNDDCMRVIMETRTLVTFRFYSCFLFTIVAP